MGRTISGRIASSSTRDAGRRETLSTICAKLNPKPDPLCELSTFAAPAAPDALTFRGRSLPEPR